MKVEVVPLVEEAEDRAGRAGLACAGMVRETVQYREPSATAESMIVELARLSARWANRVLNLKEGGR